MRVLAACLVGFLGLGALTTMAACSDSTDMGSAGAAGTSGGAPGGAGKAGSAGSTSTAGSDGGSADCGFNSTDCSACLGDQCGAEATACSDVDSCFAALYALPKCVCDSTKDPETCIGTFVSENGAPAEKLAACFNRNCATVCQ